MKRKRFSVEQITAVLQQAAQEADRGSLSQDRHLRAELYRRKKVYGTLQPSEARELKQLRDENTAKPLTTWRARTSRRMSMRRFTRLTNAFSKKLENHAAVVAIYFMH